MDLTWLQSLDRSLFHWVNQSLANPLFDVVMPLLAGGGWFVGLALLAGVLLCWKGGVRGRLFVFMLLLSVAFGDGAVCGTLKDYFGRPRPFVDLPDTILRAGAGPSFSLPSAHAANWFAALLVTVVYYRRAARWVGAAALVIAFSRVYLGVHYPADVLVGAVVGAGSAIAVMLVVHKSWQRLGPACFPEAWHRVPSLLKPDDRTMAEGVPVVSLDESVRHLRRGYLIIAVTLLARLWYLASGRIELSEDEAYQWLWSKHLALSYYSKPPMIAYAQFLGTSLWGDTQFGVRFLSPVITAVMSLLLLRFLAREATAFAGLVFVCVICAVPLMGVGGVLMTIDPLAAMFWALAMRTGWRAINSGASSAWVWTGVWMGFGFLSKYTLPLQLACWVFVFALHPPARAQLRRAGPWLAVGIALLFTIPVLLWNAQNQWITFTHLSERGGLDLQWTFTLKYLGEFVVAELFLLNAVVAVAIARAAWGLWRAPRQPLLVFLFAMSVPVFLFYMALTLRARVHPNWIAPVVIPLVLLGVVFWEQRWRAGERWVKHAYVAALALGLPVVILLHDTNLIGKLTGHPLPVNLDPGGRLRRSSETARVVGLEWKRLNAEGAPAFIIGGHYGLVGVVSFYLPEAKALVSATQPLAYQLTSDVPKNQLYFWPGYTGRTGQNAIFVHEADEPQPSPEKLLEQFRSVRDLGMRDVVVRGRVLDRLQLFECRDLK